MVAHIQRGRDGAQREQPVFEHLNRTARIARLLGTPLGMGCLAYMAAILHDCGKWRKRFEKYLRAAVSGTGSARRGEVNHSSAGAIYVYQRYYRGSAAEKLTAQVIAAAILSHHGLNDCMTPEGIDYFHQRVGNLEDLDYEEVIKNLRESPISEKDLDENFAGAVKEVEILSEKAAPSNMHSFGIGVIQRLLTSVLIDADRLETAVFCGDREEGAVAGQEEHRWENLCESLENTLKKFKGQEEVSLLRRRVAEECLEFAGQPEGIYRLSVPTGGGKTLSGMRFALNHARIHGKERIFYIGPHLSILEQNSQVFREAIGHEDMILEHHSNVIVQDYEEEGRTEKNRYKHLTENWDSPIVITTFVQFLNTLFAGSTQSVRRFHNLAGAVIVIDEIQSLPIKMIHMFNMTMNCLHKMCRATVVLCSATQPVLDKVDFPIRMSEPRDMIEKVGDLYRRLRRVRVEEKKEPLDTVGLRRLISEIMEEQRDVLVILNTKEAVGLLYREMDSYYRETGDAVLLIHLSTNMCAEHRLCCIDGMKKKLGQERVVCVSASLIEAGVDLSFSCVVRSFAGLDSIAQAAGRCNRNKEAAEGTVYLVHDQTERLGPLEQVRKGAQCSQAVVDRYLENPEQYGGDLLSPEALEDFYRQYYYDEDQRRWMNYPLREWGSSMVDLLSANKAGKMAFVGLNGREKDPGLRMYQAFKSAGKAFEVIDQDTVGVIVPYGEGRGIIEALNGNLPEKEISLLVRRAQRFTVNLRRRQVEKLKGAVYSLNAGNALALKSGFYDKDLGVTGEGIQEFLDI